MSKNGDFHRFQGTPGYIASGPLVDAVNCAIALGRPLLLKGEPGTGKTVLAGHVAEGLGMPMLQWHIKSTTKAADGLYVYDTVQRLYDSRFGDGDIRDIRRYIKLGPLGQAVSSPERDADKLMDCLGVAAADPSLAPARSALPPAAGDRSGYGSDDWKTGGCRW